MLIRCNLSTKLIVADDPSNIAAAADMLTDVVSTCCLNERVLSTPAVHSIDLCECAMLDLTQRSQAKGEHSGTMLESVGGDDQRF